MFILQVMSTTVEDSIGVKKSTHRGTTSLNGCTRCNSCKISSRQYIYGTLQGIIGFTNIQVQVLVDDGCYSQDSSMYWKFAYIKEQCQLKSNIPTIPGGVPYGDRKINVFQTLAYCVTYLMLQGRIINLNNFKLILLLIPLRSPEFILKTQEIKKGS